MKNSRLVLLAAIAGGAAFLASDRPFDAGTWPLPGSQLSVRVPFKLHRAGDYFIEVTMPKANIDKIRVVDETLPCELSYSIETNGVSSQTRRICHYSHWRRGLYRRQRARRDLCDFGGCTPADRAVSVVDLSNLPRTGRRIRRSRRADSDRTTFKALTSIRSIAGLMPQSRR